jgi:hypothetical protein
MAAADAGPPSGFTILVDAPGELFAGSSATLRISVSCPDDVNFNQMRIAIRNQDGAEIARAALTGFNVKESAPLEIVVTAPSAPGEHTYTAALVVPQPDDSLHEETSTQFSFRTNAHTVSLNVWDVAPAIEPGEKFKLKLGVRCVAGCQLSGRPVALLDHEQGEAGSSKLGSEVWPGTTALYFATLEATAPKEPGTYRWEVRSPASDVLPPHAAAALEFGVRVVPVPEHEVTVYAVDKDKQSPLKGARVVLHPYRAVTDENGMARIRVPKGEYNVLVSASKHIATGKVETVTGDIVTRAELELEPDLSNTD